MNQGGEIKVWDPLVRLVHWSLVATFAVVYLTGEEESILHIWSGYAVGVLVALRVLWGFVGTRYARFADFVYRPATVLAYAKDFLRAAPQRYIGHNPLGGAMVIALLLSLAGATLSGLWLYGAEENKGPAAPLTAGGAAHFAVIAGAHAHGDDEGEQNEHDDDGGVLGEVHEFFANLTLLLVVLHIAGVLLSSAMHRENLIRAMITGRKRI